jgi:hypothetical protein
MNFVYDAVVVLHFLGLASLIGGFLVQMSSSQRGINLPMLHGVLTQVVTGIVLVGMRQGEIGTDEAVDNTKITVKLAVAVVVLIVVLIGRRKPADAQVPYWAVAGALSIANVIVAVAW